MASDAAEKAVNMLQTRLDILQRVALHKERLDKFLDPSKSRIVTENDFLMVLRRWNSYTPAMITDPYASKGGGYFLAWKGKGIAIDPGFNFLENFRLQGFRFADIDAIIVTHAHIDHCSDLEPLLTLVYEYNDRLDEAIKRQADDSKKADIKAKRKTLDLYMNIGALKKHSGWMRLLPWKYGYLMKVQLIHPHSLEEGDVKNYKSGECRIEIDVKSCTHDEILSKICSVGVYLKLFGRCDRRKIACRIGITSDTTWNEGIQKQYQGCDLLIAHLGGVEPQEVLLPLPLSSKKSLYKNHLGIIGTTRVIDHVEPEMAIVSEFGEELGGARREIVSIINDCVSARCLVGDIGMKVKLPEVELQCSRVGCWKDAGDSAILEDSSVIYLCGDHRR